MGYLKSLATTFVWVCTILAIITFMPGLPPHSEFAPFYFKSPAPLNKQRDGRLNEVEKLFEGKIKGPEAFDAYDGVLYTTMHGGTVSKILGNEMVDVVKFGEPCDGLWEEEKCGRPLGLKFDKQGKLYVVDTYYGIYRVDVKTGKYEKIIDTSLPIEGKVPMIPNSIDVASNGDLYWTSSSSDFKLTDGLISILCNPSGRLFRYNAATKQNEVLLENLGWANGLKLSDDESFVLVAETGTSRIIKYYLKGPRAGNSEVFLEGLPGIPDNIQTDGQGNFFVSLISEVDEEHPMLIQSLTPYNYLRKMVVRTTVVLQAPFKFLEQFYPNYYSKRIIHWLGHFESMPSAFSASSLLRIDSAGNILDYLGDSDNKLVGISSAFVFGDHLYLGSPFNDYLARIPLHKAFPNLKNSFKYKLEEMKQPPMPVQVSSTTESPPSPSTSPLTTTTPIPTTTTEAPPTLPPTIHKTPSPTQEPEFRVEPVEVPVVRKPVEIPVVSKPENIPVVQRPMEVPAAPKPVEVPVVPRPVEVPPVTKPVIEPVVMQRVEQPRVMQQPEKQILRDEM